MTHPIENSPAPMYQDGGRVAGGEGAGCGAACGLRGLLEACNTFIAKREAFSYWIYPEEEEDKKDASKTYNSSIYTPTYTPKHRNKTYEALKKSRKSSSCLAWLIWLPIGVALVYFLDIK